MPRWKSKSVRKISPEIRRLCEAYWNEYHELVEMFCTARLKDFPESVDDCVSNVYLCLLNHMRLRDGNLENPKRWLLKTAFNCVNSIRLEEGRYNKYCAEEVYATAFLQKTHLQEGLLVDSVEIERMVRDILAQLSQEEWQLFN